MSCTARAIASSALALVLGCSSPAPNKMDAPNDGFDRNAMLAHLATTVYLPMQAEVEAKTAGLPAAIDAYCTALDTPTRDAAIAAWSQAVNAWQRADAVLVGPAAMNQKDLRYKIYSWPLLAPCGLDRDT